MCGITAILNKTKKNNTINYLLNSLEILQNRGYDSFGSLSLCKDISNNIFMNIKKTACVSEHIYFNNFKNLHQIENIESNLVLGHTRWATHGNISENNTHPHLSNSKKIALVHNGIIENYKELKNFLIEKSFSFYSETDTEIIVNLIDYYYSHLNKSIEDSIKKAVAILEGTYGLCIVCIDYPEKMFVLRNGSPLLIGENENFIFATSESSGFINEIKHYYSLKNNDLVILSIEEKGPTIQINENYNQIECKENNILLSPSPYKHWTLREIIEQKESLLKATNYGARICNNKIKLGGVEYLKPFINNITNVILLGCGTSLHACQIGTYYLKNNRTFNNINCYDAAEFTENELPINGKTLLIMISQSGETMDLHRVLKIIENNDDVITMGIINVVDSLIAREVDCGIYLNAGREVAVASTKSFTNSLLILYLFSLWCFQIQKEISLKKIKCVRLCIEQVGIINQICDKLIKPEFLKLLNNENLFVLGKGKMEYIAREMALKLKEICYIHAEGYSGSALKHGPFALLTKQFPVILLIDNDNKEKMINAYKEIESRGADILVISELEYLNVKNLIKVPENKYLQDIIYIVILQQIAYKLSLLREINPDKPRNLAKVVTVE